MLQSFSSCKKLADSSEGAIMGIVDIMVGRKIIELLPDFSIQLLRPVIRDPGLVIF
jgi:hypothetical protein